MGVLKTVVIVVLTLSFVVFIALFGRLPAFRKTPIGFLHRLLLLHIPNVLAKIDGVLTGGRIFRSFSRTFHYLMHEKHPVVLIFFVLLQVIGEILILPPTYPSLSLIHQLTIPVIVILPYYFLYLCTTISSAIPVLSTPSPSPSSTSETSNPPNPNPSSTATPQHNPHFHPSHHAALTAYPYDTLLYHPGYFCRTCAHPKPARSKHCSLCRACIQRQDHHCIWINNCVGRNNHVYFLLLLVAITVLLVYGSVLGYHHLTSLLTARYAPSRLLRGSSSAKATKLLWRKRLTWTQLGNAYVTAFTLSPAVGATTLLTVMCTPLSTGFLVYHAYLLWAGATTNETNKWAEFREDVLDGMVCRARTEELRRGGVYGALGAFEALPREVEPGSEEVDWPPARIPGWWWWWGWGGKGGRRNGWGGNSSSNSRVRTESQRQQRYQPQHNQQPDSNQQPNFDANTQPNNRRESQSQSDYNSESQSEHSHESGDVHDYESDYDFKYRPEYWYTTTTTTTPSPHGPTLTIPHSKLPNNKLPPNLQKFILETTPHSIILQDNRWTKVRKGDLKALRNIYDLGFWGNLGEVVFH